MVHGGCPWRVSIAINILKMRENEITKDLKGLTRSRFIDILLSAFPKSSGFRVVSQISCSFSDFALVVRRGISWISSPTANSSHVVAHNAHRFLKSHENAVNGHLVSRCIIVTLILRDCSPGSLFPACHVGIQLGKEGRSR